MCCECEIVCLVVQRVSNKQHHCRLFVICRIQLQALYCRSVFFMWQPAGQQTKSASGGCTGLDLTALRRSSCRVDFSIAETSSCLDCRTSRDTSSSPFPRDGLVCHSMGRRHGDKQEDLPSSSIEPREAATVVERRRASLLRSSDLLFVALFRHSVESFNESLVLDSVPQVTFLMVFALRCPGLAVRCFHSPDQSALFITHVSTSIGTRNRSSLVQTTPFLSCFAVRPGGQLNKLLLLELSGASLTITKRRTFS